MPGAQIRTNERYMWWDKRVLSTACILFTLTGCATESSGSGHSGSWQIDSVAQKCVASVLGGAVLGGVIGAVSGGGGRNVGTGVLIGAASGGALCAVMAALDAQDRDRIRTAQLAAAQTGRPQELAYRGNDGLDRRVTVRPTEMSAKRSSPVDRPSSERSAVPSSQAEISAASGARVCRRLDTTVSVQSKGEAAVPAQLVCRTPGGDWEPTAS